MRAFFDILCDNCQSGKVISKTRFNLLALPKIGSKQRTRHCHAKKRTHLLLFIKHVKKVYRKKNSALADKKK